MNPQPQVTSPTLYPLGHDCPHECMSAASIALEVAEGECQLVSAQTIRHTATSQFAWPSSQKEASSEAGSQKSLQAVF